MGKKVFLGGLSWASTPESLCNFFTNLDFHVEKAVIICDKPTGKSRGFGFMVFSDSCNLERLQSHYKVDGRLVEVKTALRKHEIVSPVKSQTKIFVGGIPQEVTWEELQNYFSQFGEIVGGQIMIDKKTKRSRGFGFVKFLHEESVELAFNIDHYIHFKRIEIKIAESNPKTSTSSVPSGSAIDASFENSFNENSFETSLEGTNSCDSISYCENTWVNPNLSNNMIPPHSHSATSFKKQIAPRDESKSHESSLSVTPGRFQSNTPSFMSAVSNSSGLGFGERERDFDIAASNYSDTICGSPTNSYPYRDESEGSSNGDSEPNNRTSTDDSREGEEKKESKNSKKQKSRDSTSTNNNKNSNNDDNIDNDDNDNNDNSLNYEFDQKVLQGFLPNTNSDKNTNDFTLSGNDYPMLLNFKPNFISAGNTNYSPLTGSEGDININANDINYVAPISPKSIRRFFFINQKNAANTENKKEGRASPPSSFKLSSGDNNVATTNVVNANIIGAIKQHHQQQHHHVQHQQQVTQQQIQQQQQLLQQQQQLQKQHLKQQQQQQKQQERLARQKRLEERQRQQNPMSPLKNSPSLSPPSSLISSASSSNSKSVSDNQRLSQQERLLIQEQERLKRQQDRVQKQQLQLQLQQQQQQQQQQPLSPIRSISPQFRQQSDFLSFASTSSGPLQLSTIRSPPNSPTTTSFENNNNNNNNVNHNSMSTLFNSPNKINLNLALMNLDDFDDLALPNLDSPMIPMEKHIEPSLMTQLNWDSETFVPTEQEKMKIGAPIFKMKSKYL